jgi:pimeloyl-[acyl-carrier protein] synthase
LIRALFVKEMDIRRANPTRDFISSLLTAEEDGERLSDRDILATCYLTVLAGYGTTANTISLGAVQMAKDPQLWETMRTLPQEEAEKAVMEMMRQMAMFTAVQRVVKEDFIWAGQQMKAGDMMWVMAAGANRDPKVFPDPEKIDFNRNQTPNMTFAPGMHFCIGHFLAKMQLTEYYPMMAKKFVGIESLDETLHWGPTLGFRGLATWNVRFCEAAIARGMNASQ